MFFIFLCLLTQMVGTEIIAESSVEKCYQGDQLNCTQKLLVSMTLENSQVAQTEQIQITQTKSGQYLETPISITLTKSQVLALYTLKYVQDFNSRPSEQIIQSSFMDCDDDNYSDSPTCGFQQDKDGKKIPDSQGFCCSCGFTQAVGLDNDKLDRGKVCSAFNIGTGFSTASCLRYAPLWYSAFSVSTYTIYYEIQVVIQYNSSYNESMSIGSQSFVSQSPYVIARLIGDFMPLAPPPVLSHLYLMKPSRPITNARVMEGSRAWMFVPRDVVTLDASECGKVGVGYSAFRNEANACRKMVGSCLKNQLEDFYKQDLTNVANNRVPQYLLSSQGSFQEVSDSQTTYLTQRVEGKMPTLLTLEIDAKEVRFITNLGKGELDYANITDFESHSGNGVLLVQVTNTGRISSEFNIAFNCTLLVQAITAQSLYMNSQQSKQIKKQISVISDIQNNHSCTVSLFDNVGTLLDSVNVSFTSTDMIIQSAQNDTLSQNTTEMSEQPMKMQPQCDDICPSFWDFICFFKNSCSQQNYRLFSVILGIFFLVVCIGCLIKNRYAFQSSKKKKKNNSVNETYTPYIHKQNNKFQQSEVIKSKTKQKPQTTDDLEIHQLQYQSQHSISQKVLLYANINDPIFSQDPFSTPVFAYIQGSIITKLKLIKEREIQDLMDDRSSPNNEIRKLIKNIRMNKKRYLTQEPRYALL